MTSEDDQTVTALEVLKRAVAEALDRKRRLGQHAIVWRDGRIVRLGPDELPVAPPDDSPHD